MHRTVNQRVVSSSSTGGANKNYQLAFTQRVAYSGVHVWWAGSGECTVIGAGTIRCPSCPPRRLSSTGFGDAISAYKTVDEPAASVDALSVWLIPCNYT